MGKSWRLIAVILAMVIVGLVGIKILRRTEPVYEGKTAKEWFQIAARNNTPPDAISALLKMGSNAVPVLADSIMLAGSKKPERWQAAWVKLPRFLQKRIPEPISAIQATEKAREVIGQLPRDLRREVAARAVPTLIRAFEDRTTQERDYFFYSYILELGPDVKLMAPVINRALDDPDISVRCAGIIGLQQYNLAKDNIPRLTQLLDDPNERIRSIVIDVLGQVGPAAKPAVPALEKFLGREDAQLQPKAACALWWIDRQTNTVLTVITNVEILRYDQNSIAVLADMGDAGKVAIPNLLVVANESNNTVLAPPHRYDLFMEDVIRFACCRTIRKLDPSQDAEIVPALIDMIKNPRADKLTYTDCLGLLAKIGPGAVDAEPEVRRILRSADPKLHAAAETALKSFGAEGGR